MDTKLNQAILGLAAAGFTLGMSGLAWSDHLTPAPQLLTITGGGDPSCQEAIDVINAVPGNQFPISPRPNITDGFVELVITNPPNNATDFFTATDDASNLPAGAEITVALTGLDAKNEFKIEDMSTLPADEVGESQLLDIPGHEIAMFQRGNETYVYYQINQNDTDLVYVAPGTANQTPNKVVICWAVGPSGMPDALSIIDTCNAFNATYSDGEGGFLRSADGFQAKQEPGFGSVIPFNVSACAPRVARWCDQSLPAGTTAHPIENSCNPTGTTFGGTTSSIDAAGGSIVSSFEGMFTNF